jgi:hypothetical protein
MSASVAGVALGLAFGSQTKVHYRRASYLAECRSATHAASPSHRSPDGSLQTTRSPVKGRTPQLIAYSSEGVNEEEPSNRLPWRSYALIS